MGPQTLTPVGPLRNDYVTGVTNNLKLDTVSNEANEV
ncbi:hypothetical protein SAMN04489742_1006 [Arthrobacter crystallopoietes]|uniref:Uncharacterized protein n=1 Tax=Crystallibacter crystallopoietes TaxID=37928 RepID=A0A1H1AN18_9MICC|nr:hypothetical protein SAMN04489742_1006 [Arthrobacter crystallopoietes]